jgi:adenylyl- and sulfurtransferase ThiI
LDYLTTHTSLSPIRRGLAPGFVNYKKGCTRLAAASDKVYQLLAHGRWFSPGTPASSITKTGHHYIAEILLKVALSYTTTSLKRCIRSELFYFFIER